MRCDLHIHSYHSDGTWSPEKIASVCKEKQIDCFSVTDHNLLSAYPQAILAAEKYFQSIPAFSAERSERCSRPNERPLDCSIGRISF